MAELARAFPEGNIVLCHMGGVLGYGRWAGKKDEVFTAWKAAMAELAKCPNVSVKVGGLMMRLAAIDYLNLPAPPTSQQLADAWRPYAGTCLELFGANRCMVESNFPVDKMGIGYAGTVQRAEAHRRGRLGRREDRAVQRHGEEGLSPRVVSRAFPPLGGAPRKWRRPRLAGGGHAHGRVRMTAPSRITAPPPHEHGEESWCYSAAICAGAASIRSIAPTVALRGSRKESQ